MCSLRGTHAADLPLGRLCNTNPWVGVSVNTLLGVCYAPTTWKWMSQGATFPKGMLSFTKSK